ncbi:MAG: 16S rRNA (cytosine(1402)-N(4))-methyltransferase RsmH [bacterium]
MSHVSVLLHESIDGLDIEAGDTIIDATLGAGGHSKTIVQKFPNITIVGFDLDADALKLAKQNIENVGGTLIPVQSNFRDMDSACKAHGISEVNGVLFDFGISSMELGESGRGFSFKYDEPLLMTLQNPITDDTVTARDVVNGMREKELADIIFTYGEESFSRQIASAIVMARKRKKIETTFELAEIIRNAVPNFYKNGRINPATKTFQALRIYVNDELGAITEGLEKAWKLLASDGRIVTITFHSLEDRIVKNFFKDKSKIDERAQIITKKPIVPTREEIITNPRSRSAKLRILKKI